MVTGELENELSALVERLRFVGTPRQNRHHAA
jgi:hypothetical protein